MKISKGKIILIIILTILVIDQALKFWIKTNMALGDEFRILGDWFIIHFVENNGMAFGFEFAGEYGKMFLSIFRIIAVTVIGWYLVRMVRKNESFGFLLSVALIFTGALGNIIDSAFYGLLFDHSYGQVASFLPEGGGYNTFLHGKVVDMFYFPILTGTYPDWFPFWAGNEFIFFRPVFNIADSSITVGIFLILLFYRKHFDHGTQPHDNENLEITASETEVPGEIAVEEEDVEEEIKLGSPEDITEKSSEQDNNGSAV
jgi:signal peptidase II